MVNLIKNLGKFKVRGSKSVVSFLFDHELIMIIHYGAGIASFESEISLIPNKSSTQLLFHPVHKEIDSYLAEYGRHHCRSAFHGG